MQTVYDGSGFEYKELNKGKFTNIEYEVATGLTFRAGGGSTMTVPLLARKEVSGLTKRTHLDVHLSRNKETSMRTDTVKEKPMPLLTTTRMDSVTDHSCQKHKVAMLPYPKLLPTMGDMVEELTAT